MNLAASTLPPLVLFEDDHLLVINKPAGWNTHAPSPYAGEGVYDWLRHREPRWGSLAIIHRLDKETSGVLVFARTPEANRSLTAQFTAHSVRKRYVFVTDRQPRPPGHLDSAEVQQEGQGRFTVLSTVQRAGERYVSSLLRRGGERAETRFHVLDAAPGHVRMEAEPITGRTHQIRVHAATQGLPILGDTLYGGTPAHRVCLHAASLTLRHPVTGEQQTWTAPPDFEADPRLALRRVLIPPSTREGAQLNAFRLIHGAADRHPGWYVDRLGDYLLSQSEQALNPEQQEALATGLALVPSPSRGAYHKILNRRVRKTDLAQASPQHVFGESAPERFEILENGVRFELSFAEGYSVGLFLDQRDNRRRFLVNHVAAGFPLFPPGDATVLNTFAYTCGFSVCAALAGAHTTSLDLSRKYLDWGRRNFTLNGLDPDSHEFLIGDTFDWMRRLTKKNRAFDVVVLDPPTFSMSKVSGVFRVEQDFGRLVTAALGVLKPGGVLLASANAATLKPELFVDRLDGAVRAAGRTIRRTHYVPQPPDFPISREEPGHLKTIWLGVD